MPGKLLDRLVLKHIHNHFIEISCCNSIQSGFVPGHSTITHVLGINTNSDLSVNKQELYDIL